jgi:hypothetical protein
MRTKAARGSKNRFTLHLILEVGYVACVEHAADKFFDHIVIPEMPFEAAEPLADATVAAPPAATTQPE